jgi:hypothetical protein
MTTITITQTFTSKTRNGGGGGAPPLNTVAPVISGSSAIGSTLSSTTGTWTGTPTITYSYQWKRAGVDIVGETNSTYVLVVADYNVAITCVVTATNAFGSASATSNSITGTGVAPVNTVVPVISGTPTVGQTLSSTTGTWTGNPAPTYTYQWKRNGSNIVSATSSTYTLVQADATFAITCAVTGTNVAGAAEATSNSLTVFDADAQAFITAAGLTNPTQQNAINTLVVSMKGFGIWTKMKAIYPMVGGTATTHKYNLINPADTNAAFRLVFFGGWTHTTNGAQGNGTNTYADSFFIPSTQYSVIDNAALSVYSRTNIVQGACEIGCFNGSNSALQINVATTAFAPQNTGTYMNNVTESKFADTDSRGFYITSRTGTTVTMFENSTLKVTQTTTALARPNVKIYVGAQNNAGAANIPSSKQLAFASIGDGLTNTDAANFYTAVQAFQTTLGRQV